MYYLQGMLTYGWHACCMYYAGAVMHHKAVLLSDNRLLICGGRMSPTKASSSFYLLTFPGDNKAEFKEINLNPNSVQLVPRWRHSLNALSIEGRKTIHILPYMSGVVRCMYYLTHSILCIGLLSGKKHSLLFRRLSVHTWVFAKGFHNIFTTTSIDMHAY